MVTETITSPEMRAIETNAEYYGISLLQLMETAGRNVAEEIASRFNPKKTKLQFFVVQEETAVMALLRHVILPV